MLTIFYLTLKNVDLKHNKNNSFELKKPKFGQYFTLLRKMLTWKQQKKTILNLKNQNLDQKKNCPGNVTDNVWL